MTDNFIERRPNVKNARIALRYEEADPEEPGLPEEADEGGSGLSAPRKFCLGFSYKTNQQYGLKMKVGGRRFKKKFFWQQVETEASNEFVQVYHDIEIDAGESHSFIVSNDSNQQAEYTTPIRQNC